MATKPVAIVGQIVLYGAFAAFIGFFATSPRYQHLAPDQALVKLSLAHFGDRECRKRTAEELKQLPPNMRAPMECPRERSPLTIELWLQYNNGDFVTPQRKAAVNVIIE